MLAYKCATKRYRQTFLVAHTLCTLCAFAIIKFSNLTFKCVRDTFAMQACANYSFLIAPKIFANKINKSNKTNKLIAKNANA